MSAHWFRPPLALICSLFMCRKSLQSINRSGDFDSLELSDFFTVTWCQLINPKDITILNI